MNHRKTAKNDRLLPRITTPVTDFLKRFSLFLFLAVSLTSVMLSSIDTKFLSTFRTSLTDALLPIYRVISQPVNYANFLLESVQDWSHLHNENMQLRQKNNELTRFYDASKRFEAENAQLRKLLNFVAEPHMVLITARIVGNTSGPYIRTAVINAGNIHGIRKGQVVINEHGLVGRIIEVGEHTSRILLITDLNSKIPVITQDSRERAIAAGNNAEILNLLYLPEDSKVKIGEMVITSGDGELFPSGLPIGRVESKTEKTATITPAIDWSKLEFVSVINY